MDKKSKIFFIVLFLLIVGAVAVAYYKYIVKRDYIVQAEADCDPYMEACFVYVCDPEVGEECTGDPAEDTSYYKLIDRNAKNIPLCDPSAEGCDALTCPTGEADCAFTLCDLATAKDGEVCNDPVAYTLANPVEEEDAASEEDAINEEVEGEDGAPADTEEGNQPEETSAQDETTTGDVGVGNTGADQVRE